MKYINNQDLKSKINDSLLLKIIENDTAILDHTEKIAIDTLKTKLPLYNWDSEFEKKDTDRNAYIVNMISNIVLYEINMRMANENIDPKYIKNYNDALEDISFIARGKMHLATIPQNNTSNTIQTLSSTFKIFSNNPRNNTI